MRLITIILVLCVSAVNLIHADDWTSLGNDATRARSTEEKLSDTFIPDWQHTVTDSITSSPAVADGCVVFACRDGAVRALKETDGSLLWTSAISGDIIASPAIYQGRIYIPSDNKVHCLRLLDGVPLWNYQTTSTDISSPLVLNNRIYLGLGFPNQKVIAIDITATATPAWQAPTEQIVYSSPAISGATLIIGCDSGRYYALNTNTGSETWSYPTGGAVLLSSPLISNTSVYLLPGGNDLNFYSIDIDDANWPVSNYQIALADPASGTIVGDIIATKLATSSPIKAGDYVGFTVRFDYSVDTDSDTIADQYVLNEYAFAIDPVTPTASVKWQVALGTLITANQNNIPPYGLCPTPLAMQNQSGQTVLAVASSLSSELRVLGASNGAILWNYTLDSATQSSPVAANGRLLVATKNGSLYAFQSTNSSPQPVSSGFSPATGTTITVGTATFTPTLTWSSATDTNDASVTLQYQVRIDDDGEVIESYDSITTTSAGITSITFAPIPITSTLQLTYSIRTIDPSNAYSAWSDRQTYSVFLDTTAPDAPGNLMATPSNGYVNLFWTASPSTDTAGYLVAYGEISGTFGSYLAIGNVTNYQVTGLTNGITYVFSVVAEDMVGLQSSPVEATAAPDYHIFLNGAPYETLSDAVSIAQSGDTITLSPITFVVPGTLYLKPGVSISGYAPHLTILQGPSMATLFELTGPTVVTKGVISNLTLTGAGIGIDASSYGLEVRNVILRQMGTGIFGNDTSDLIIVNNTFISHTDAAINVAGQTAIRNNIIVRNAIGIWWSGIEADLPKLSITYNDVYGNATDYLDCTIGNGNISENVAFRNEAANDYREVVGSKTVDTGSPSDTYALEPSPNGGRINMGAFGNTPYATISQSAGSSAAYKGMNNGCFIATAVYGSYNHPNVMVLRNFRDRHLITNAPGRRFVSLYYKVSPPIAEYLKQSPVKAGVVRLALTPVVYAMKYHFTVLGFFILLAGVLYFTTKVTKNKIPSIKRGFRGV
ncbi:MAG: PQQ-binding-like beta-propeller repeat protein [Planctomycetes bacterium]|nr:PQQ-binding-like beta-propeller repeat protein [Planctomycetota bacterium]